MSLLRHFLLSAVLLPASALACSQADDESFSGESQLRREPAAPDPSCATAHGESHFDYADDGPHGPSRWDDIEDAAGAPAYPACADGTGQQSPITLPGTAAGTELGSFALDAALRWTRSTRLKGLVNDGHSWRANIDPSATASLQDGATGQSYKLAQFHFHVPSEHTIGGRRFPMELHFVHLDGSAPAGIQEDAADLRPFAEVVAVLFEEQGSADDDNVVLARMWPDGHSPNRFRACRHDSPTDFSADIDLEALLPTDRSYFQYDGSLTTPPCSKRVRFRVLSSPVRASKRQIDALRGAFDGDNSRPTQPILTDTVITQHPARQR